MRKPISATGLAFQQFVLSHSDAPSGGSPHSWRRALELLSEVFKVIKPSIVTTTEIWDITDPTLIMQIYDMVKLEQNKLSKNDGIFVNFLYLGSSYFRRGWCSAALKLYAEFRSYTNCDSNFEAAFTSADDGHSVARAAERIDLGNLDWCVPDEIDPTSKIGREKIEETKVRIGQEKFRKWILRIYDQKCCVSGLAVPEVLRASHIVAWRDDEKVRLDPANGLCLSATYDAAFDKHLISFDSDFRMILSPMLREYCTDKVHREYFLRFEGQKLALPTKFLPSQEYLEKHRSKMAT